MLEKTPEKVGKFHFDKFGGYAEITGKGTVAILGTGGEVGADPVGYGLSFAALLYPITIRKGYNHSLLISILQTTLSNQNVSQRTGMYQGI